MPTLPDEPGLRMKSILTVESLTAGYGGAPVVTDVSATIGPGEVVAVVGPNGAGKSTFAKAVLGVVRVYSGRVFLRGEEVTKLSLEALARQGVGYLPQAREVFPDLTVRENLEMGGYLLSKQGMVERVEAVLVLFPSLVGMLKRGASKLSGGEQKIVGLARVLMAEPTLIVLDEPTAGLAPELARRFLEQDIKRLATNGVALLLVEQRAAAAMEISSRTLVMVSGQIVLDGSSQELLARPDFVDVFLGGDRGVTGR